jgi:hypothetical protein
LFHAGISRLRSAEQFVVMIQLVGRKVSGTIVHSISIPQNAIALLSPALIDGLILRASKLY